MNQSVAITELKKILVVANADSPLLRERVTFPLKDYYNIIWFSESYAEPDTALKYCHAKRHGRLGILFKVITVFKFLTLYHIEKPDIVHAHWSIFPALLFRHKWRKLVISPMGSDIFIDGLFGLRKFVSRLSLLKADIVTSKSEYMDRRLIELGVPKDRIRRITWGIEDVYFSANDHKMMARKKLELAENELIVFSPRAVQPLYRIDAILKSFGNYILNGGEGTLLVSEMYGTAGSRRTMEKMVREKNLEDCVKFLGPLSRSDMVDCYAASDVVVSYAASDGLPQTLFETFASGCFPVFSDLPQYHSLLKHKINGFLCNDSKGQQIEDGLEFAVQALVAGKFVDINRNLALKIANRNIEIKKINNIYCELTGKYETIDLDMAKTP